LILNIPDEDFFQKRVVGTNVDIYVFINYGALWDLFYNRRFWPIKQLNPATLCWNVCSKPEK